MGKTRFFLGTASILCLAISGTLHAQIDVQSDGAVKIGALDKANNLAGSSLEVAVNKMFIYPTNNLNGAFTIYNNTRPLVISSSGVTPALGVYPFDDLPTYIEPRKAGWLIAGTSSNPLGGVFTQELTSYSQSMASDSRVKKNILDLPSALEGIRLLRPVSFDFDTEKVPLLPALASNRVGFIAQEVQEVFPSLVHYDSLADLHSLDYVAFIPYLTKAIQEQDSIIRQQQELMEAYAEALADMAERLSSLEAQGQGANKAPRVPQNPSNNAEPEEKTGYVLYQNVPNPATGETRIGYETRENSASARIGIYELDGKQVDMYSLEDRKGEIVLHPGELQAGMYLYSLIVDGKIIDTKRMVVAR